MTKQTEFQKQLSDPRWQKKRLEILERDEWTCKACGDTKATLTVHHKSYRMEGGKFADVWDYKGNDLITLCEKCHSFEEVELERIKRSIFFDLRRLCENTETIIFLMDVFNTINATKKSRVDVDDINKILGFVFKEYEVLK